MILSDLKSYFITNKVANLNDLTIALQAEPDAIRAMLQHWIRKGVIERRQVSDACGKACTKCDPLLTEIYEWTGDGAMGCV